MLPVISIVGRPNVGKSTLFNCLTKTRDALVIDLPGTTRDRKYGEGKIGDQPYIVIDTGGIGDEVDSIDNLMASQSWHAIEESDVVLFVVDARVGVTTQDEKVARLLRPKNKHIIIVVNKIDGLQKEIAAADFFKLGIQNLIAISASQRSGISQLADKFLAYFQPVKTAQTLPETDLLSVDDLEDAAHANATVNEDDLDDIDYAYDVEEKEIPSKPEYDDLGIKIAIIGKPNVGKSTLVNRILGEERVVVFDLPGTTRDSIYIPFERRRQKYTIIDTAGIRKRGKITDLVEKFSVVKALQAIENCNVALIVIDAREGVSDQDLSLLEFAVDTGRAIVIAINKWDGMDIEQKEEIKKTIGYKLAFVDFAKKHFISALHGSGVGDLFDSINAAYKAATKKHSTAKITEILLKLVLKFPPPMVSGRRIKLRYAHAGGHNPPRIIIHGNQTDKVPDSYKRYLINNFIKLLKLEGTPVKLEFKTSDNPYQGKHNPLTLRQQRKRQRVVRHRKKSKK